MKSLFILCLSLISLNSAFSASTIKCTLNILAGGQVEGLEESISRVSHRASDDAEKLAFENFYKDYAVYVNRLESEKSSNRAVVVEVSGGSFNQFSVMALMNSNSTSDDPIVSWYGEGITEFELYCNN